MLSTEELILKKIQPTRYAHFFQFQLNKIVIGKSKSANSINFLIIPHSPWGHPWIGSLDLNLPE